MGPRIFVGVGVEILDRVIGREKLDRGLFADARHAGDVVGVVAHQRLEIDELVRAQAVAFGQFGNAIEDGFRRRAASGIENANPVRDELEHVPVAGQDQHIDVLRFGLARQCAQYVVRFIVGVGDDRDAKRVEKLLDAPQLRAHVVGHGIARGLVLRKLSVPPGVAGVERDGDIIRLIFLEDAEQFADKPIDRGGRFTVARSQRGLDPEESAIGL